MKGPKRKLLPEAERALIEWLHRRREVLAEWSVSAKALEVGISKTLIYDIENRRERLFRQKLKDCEAI